MVIAERQPSNIPDASRIIVIGDVHGDVERFIKMVKTIGLFSNNLEWIAEPRDTIVIQLGDQIDSLSRRTDNNPELENWESIPDVEMLQLMDQLDINAQYGSEGRGRVLSLLGNHEIMNTQGLFHYVSANSMARVGGEAARAQLFSPGNQFAQILSRRNIVTRIGPFLFCHGGLLPEHLNCVYNNFDTINICMQKYLRGGEPLTPEELFVINEIIFHGENGIVWLRKYIELANHQPEILDSLLTDIGNRTNTTVLFVGHNTVDNITRTPSGKLYLTDAGFSRAYSLHDNYVEVIEIRKTDGSYNLETIRVGV
jgi:hypothetical protein